MKKILVVIFLFCLLTQSKSEQILPIDTKKGYKDFIIGDSLKKWSNQLDFSYEYDHIKFYNYNGKCCKELYGKTITNIKLGFENAKLLVIYVQFETVNYELLGDNYLKYYEDDFITAFGKPTHQSKGKDDMKNLLESWNYSWVGKKITLELTTHYGQSFDGKMTASFLIFPTSENLSNRKLKEF